MAGTFPVELVDTTPKWSELDDDQLVSADDVGAMTNMTGRAIREKARLGELPAVRISERCVRFRVRDIRQWLQSRTVIGFDPVAEAHAERRRRAS